MTIEANINVYKTPIRFLPECSTGLKMTLTNRKLELATLEELSNDVIKTGRFGYYFGENSANSLAKITLKYLNTPIAHVELNVPRKYETTVDMSKFII